MTTIYGYARTSTLKQSVKRQIDNIQQKYPKAIIFSEQYTGTKMDRPVWNKLYKQVHEGDTIVFDEISRMSRNADEGFATYEELYKKGVNLIFIKEPTLNTDIFKNAVQFTLTGNQIEDCAYEFVNKLTRILLENQIKVAFKTAQHEVDFLHQRTSEGVKRAQAEGKQVGRIEGAKIKTKKSIEAKKTIKKHHKLFDGTLNDVEVMKLAEVSRNTYYKYKAELKKEMGLL